MGRLEEALLVAEQGEQALLEHKGGAQGNGKWPSENAAYRKPKHALRRLDPAAPIDKGSRPQHRHVHGEARRQVGGAGVKVARAEDEGGDEEEAHAGVEGEADGSPHQRLAKGAAESQGIADKVEFGDLHTVSEGQDPVTPRYRPTLLECGSSRRMLPTVAWRPMYSQLRMAKSGEYSHVWRP